MKRISWRTGLSLIVAAFSAGAGAQSCPSLPSSGMTRAQLESVLRNRACGIRKLADVLPLLPQDFRNNTAFAYRSRSLQGPQKLNFRYPRAIVYGAAEANLVLPDSAATLDVMLGTFPNHRLIFTFNGHPSQPFYNSLEVVEINPNADPVFNYFSIDFPEKPSASWDGDQAQIKVSANNPATCVKCHGENPRPLIGTYPFWEGFYGSKRFAVLSSEKTPLPLPGDQYSDVELSNLQALFAAQDPRYKYVLTNPTDIGLYDFQRIDNLKQAPETLDQILNLANGERVARLMRQDPLYSKMKYALLGGLLTCSDWPSFIPPDVLHALEINLEPNLRLTSDQAKAALHQDWAQWSSGSMTDFRDIYFFLRASKSEADFNSTMAQQFGADDFFFRLQMDTMALQTSHRDSTSIAPLRLLMEGRGLSITNWFTDLAQPTYRPTDGNLVQRNFVLGLLHQDPELRAFASQIPAHEYGSYDAMTMPNGSTVRNYPICRILREKSLEALASTQIAQLQPAPPKPYPAVFTKTCAKCHDDPAVNFAPRIPFAHEDKLREQLPLGLSDRIWMRLNAPEGFQMAPTRILSPRELSEVRQYLDHVN